VTRGDGHGHTLPDDSHGTVMEIRWAKMISKSDCLISSDVYRYLYFDLVRYMKCNFSLW